MEANTSAAAQAAVHANGGATNATAAGKVAGQAKLGLPHPGAATGHAAASGAGATGGAPTSAAGSAGAHGGATASAHIGIRTLVGAHVGMKAPAVTLVLKASALAKSLAVVSLGVVGVVVAAHTGVVPAAQVGLSAVPTWSSGPSLVAHLHAGLGGRIGLGGSGGVQLGL
jgi:hypothetical protein